MPTSGSAQHEKYVLCIRGPISDYHKEMALVVCAALIFSSSRANSHTTAKLLPLPRSLHCCLHTPDLTISHPAGDHQAREPYQGLAHAVPAPARRVPRVRQGRA
jgi:hypothetical protein